MLSEDYDNDIPGLSMHTCNTLGHLRRQERREPSCTFPTGRQTTAGGRHTTQPDSLCTRQPSENPCWQKSKAASPVCFRRITTTTSLDSACALATLLDTSGGINQAAHSPLVVKQPPVVAAQPSKTLLAHGSPQKIHAGRNQRHLHQYAFGGLRQRHPWAQHAHLQHSWTPPAAGTAGTKLHIPRWSSNNRRWSPHNPARLSWHTAALRKSVLAEINCIFTSMLSEDYDNDILDSACSFATLLDTSGGRNGRNQAAHSPLVVKQPPVVARQPSKTLLAQALRKSMLAEIKASSPVCPRRITTTTSLVSACTLATLLDTSGGINQAAHSPLVVQQPPAVAPQPSKTLLAQALRKSMLAEIKGIFTSMLSEDYDNDIPGLSMHICNTLGHLRRHQPSCTFPAGRQTTAGGRHTTQQDSLGTRQPSENPCWQKSKASSPVRLRRITTTTSLDSACTFATLLDTSGGINQAAHSPLVVQQPPVVAPQPSKTLLARGSPQKIHAGRNQRHLHQYAFGGLRQRHPWTQHAHLQNSGTPPAAGTAGTKLHIPRWSSNNRRWSPHNPARVSLHAAALRKSMLAEIKGIFTSMLSEDYDNDIPGLSMHICNTLGHLRRQERQEPSCTFPAGRQTAAGGRHTTQQDSRGTRQPSENPCWQKSTASSPVCFRRITTTTSWTQHAHLQHSWTPPAAGTAGTKLHIPRWSSNNRRWSPDSPARLSWHKPSENPCWQKSKASSPVLSEDYANDIPGLSMHICNTLGHLRRHEPSCTFPAGRPTTAGGRPITQQDSFGTRQPSENPCWQKSKASSPVCFRRITTTTSQGLPAPIRRHHPIKCHPSAPV